jgi:hypothetical protein
MLWISFCLCFCRFSHPSLKIVAWQNYRIDLMKSKPNKPVPPEPVEWDLSEPFGVLPQDLSLSHNLGCVRSSSGKKEIKPSSSDTPNSKK